MKIKVNGDLSSILEDNEIYTKLLLKQRSKGESALIEDFMLSFRKEDSENIENQILELIELEKQKKSVEKRNSELEIQVSNLEFGNELEVDDSNSLENENVDLEVQQDILENESENLEKGSEDLDFTSSTFSANSFISKMMEINTKSVRDNGTIVHGIFIDEWVKPKKVEESIEVEYTKARGDTIIHGVYIDEWEKVKETVENNLSSSENSSINHGIYIDEWVEPKGKKESTSNKEFEEEMEEEWEEDIDSVENTQEDITHGIYIDEWIKSKVEIEEWEEDEYKEPEDIEETNGELGVIKPKVTEEFEELKESKEVKEKVEVVKEEVIVVPTNIRDFIKGNQGVEMSRVLQYYTKKDVSKAISLGRIYQKSGRLYT